MTETLRRPRTHASEAASTLLLSMSCIAGLAIAAALTLQRISPRFQLAAQAAAWQEARLSSEAGIDVALVELEQNAIGFNEGKWNGWYEYSQGAPAPTLTEMKGSFVPLPLAAGSGKGETKPKESGGLLGGLLGGLGGVVEGVTGGLGETLDGVVGGGLGETLDGIVGGLGETVGGLLGATEKEVEKAAKEAAKAVKRAKRAGQVVPATPETLGYANSLLALIGNPVQVSEPIFLDDVKMATAGNRQTHVDVQLWAVYPTPNPYARWYRLRSIATVSLPPTATRTTDRTEGEFRRFSLRKVREQLQYDDMGKATGIPAPSTSRITEVLVEPVLPFQLAILTDQAMSLGTSGAWAVDSYDSNNPNKSVLDGQYPGRLSTLTQENGHIGTNAIPAGGTLYGPVITAAGTLVRGAVATNGADDPATPAHENLTGATKIDPARIRSDFFREIRPLARPKTGIFRLPPVAGEPFVAGSPSQPTFYMVTKDLHAFKVVPPPLGGAGAAVIMVNGDLTVPEGTISIAANVQVQVFVAGNVDFYNRPINVGRRPAQLQIYGEDSKGAPRSLRAFGDASITAAFYGPHYDVRLANNVEWFGAVAARSFEMLGGGTGGFHYDEALAVVGAPIGFRIARYVEDVRQ